MNASQSSSTSDRASDRASERLMPAERRLALLEVFREITRELFSRPNTLDIAEIFLERCSGALRADLVSVYLGRDEYEVELLVSVSQAQSGFLSADHRLAETVMRTGQVLEEGPSPSRPGGALAMPLNVSVVGTRRITGVITAEYVTRQPDPADLETLALFAPLLAAALELAHRHRREQHRLRDERLRAEVTEAVSRLRRIPELSQAVANVITQILGYQMVAIFSFEAAATHLKLEAWSGASMPRPQVPLHGTQTGEAVQRGEACILDLSDPRFLQTDIPINSMICVPLVGRDGVLGCLNVATGGKEFLDINDLKRLQSIINPVAVAFENARLYEALEQRTQDLELMSREAQRAALHDHLTGLPNRRAFDTQIRALMRAPNATFCLGVIDLVGFKKINDQLGHVSGDIALIRIAATLRSVLGITSLSICGEQDPVATSVQANSVEANSDQANPVQADSDQANPNQDGCAFRVGGDEFHLLLPFDPKHAKSMMKTLIEKVNALEIEGDAGSLPLGLNVGLAEYPLEASTLDQLQSLADDRMYAAKRAKIPMLELD